jgi:hypothetical protein
VGLTTADRQADRLASQALQETGDRGPVSLCTPSGRWLHESSPNRHAKWRWPTASRRTGNQSRSVPLLIPTACRSCARNWSVSSLRTM